MRAYSVRELFWRQARQVVARTTELEGTTFLEVLCLEVEGILTKQRRRKRGRCQNRGSVDLSFYRFVSSDYGCSGKRWSGLRRHRLGQIVEVPGWLDSWQKQVYLGSGSE